MQNPLCLGASPRLRIALLAVVLLTVAAAANAARPMVTDDARIVDPHSCQLETWVKADRSSEAYWAVPACNIGGNFEFALGAARTDDASGTRTSDVQIQGKTLFKTLQPNGWAWGLAAGSIGHPDRGDALHGDLYAYVPATFSFHDDRLLLHTNLGWLRTRDDGRNAATWGVGGEAELSARTWLIAESYGDDHSNPYYQLGLRHWLITNRVQLDATYGNRSDGGAGWVSLGLRLLSPAFLP
ncbi:MAG TPA: hypothetical protein VN028_08915 [Rhodocyclaceae bacterium]|nr:hypothetical protein [Rhodocyclaceae bacterium]